jgi:hypothetical protein
MLNKKICKKCKNLVEDISGMYCRCKLSYFIGSRLVIMKSIDQFENSRIPESCPYELEHEVSNVKQRDM